MLRLLGLSGSLRQDSHNTNLLRAAAALLPQGVELEVYDGLRELPPYDADLDIQPADQAVARLRDAIADADGLVIRHPRVQRVNPRRAQERAGLGLAAVSRQFAARQAGRGDRRVDGAVRCRLGAGRHA